MELTGILHAHSTYSYDAKLSLREIRELCLKNNVQFVCMTEHVDELIDSDAQAFVEECAELSDEKFLFIPGFEVPYKVKEVNGETREAGLGHKHAHILIIGMREFLGNYAPDIETLKKWTEKAQFVVLAHPVRNHFLVDDGLLNEIHALEVWNQQYEGKRVPRTRSLALLEELRSRKRELLAVGGVDFHRTEHFGAPFVTLAVDTFAETSILEKLKMGAYKVFSKEASFFGTLSDVTEVKKAHRYASTLSVTVIVLGKFVNKILAGVGLSLPKSLKQRIRQRL